MAPPQLASGRRPWSDGPVLPRASLPSPGRQRLEMAGSHVAGSWPAAWDGESWNFLSFLDFLEFYWDLYEAVTKIFRDWGS